MQTTPYDSQGNLVFWCQTRLQNFNGVNAKGGPKQRWGRLKLVIFHQNLAISQKQYKIRT